MQITGKLHLYKEYQIKFSYTVVKFYLVLIGILIMWCEISLKLFAFSFDYGKLDYGEICIYCWLTGFACEFV